MIKAVIFDFDGVLGDTWDKSIGICRELGHTFTIDDFRDHHNGNVFEEPKIKFTKESTEKFFATYEDRASAEKLFPLKEELEKLEKKYEMFVVSSSPKVAIKKYFSLGGWTHFFEEVFGMETDKSKVVKLEKIFSDYNLKPEECVFVTDTLGDLIEGEKVGVKTLAVTWGYHDEARLKKRNPDKIIHEFDELSSAINEM